MVGQLKLNALSAWLYTTSSWEESTIVTSSAAATMYDGRVLQIHFLFHVRCSCHQCFHPSLVRRPERCIPGPQTLPVEQLIGNYHTRKLAGCPRKRPRPPSSSIPTDHFPTHCTKSWCVYCKDFRPPSWRKQSVWACTACDGHPTLSLTGTNDSEDCYRLRP